MAYVQQYNRVKIKTKPLQKQSTATTKSNSEIIRKVLHFHSFWHTLVFPAKLKVKGEHDMAKNECDAAHMSLRYNCELRKRNKDISDCEGQL